MAASGNNPFGTNPFQNNKSFERNPFNPTPAKSNPPPNKSQVKPDNAHLFRHGFPKPEEVFNEGKQLTRFAQQLKQLAANNPFPKAGYWEPNGGPTLRTAPPGVPYPNPHYPDIPNPNYRRVPIQMKQIRVTSIRGMPPRTPPPPKPTGFRKASKIVAGNQFAPPDPFAGFNHGAVLGYSKAVWQSLDEARRGYAMIWDYLLSNPSAEQRFGDSGVKHPDWMALVHGFMKWVTSVDVQQKVRIAWVEYGDFVITVTDAMLRQQAPFLDWLGRLRMWEDPIDARGAAVNKTPAVIEALNDFFMSLLGTKR